MASRGVAATAEIVFAIKCYLYRDVGGPRKQGASGTIYVQYLPKGRVELASRVPSGSLLKLRLPKKNASKAINYTFHVSAQLAQFVTALVSASSTDRTDRWTEWAEWSDCSVDECGTAGLRTRRRVCVSTTGGACKDVSTKYFN